MLVYLSDLLTAVLEAERNLAQVKKIIGKNVELFGKLDRDGAVSEKELKTALACVGIDATEKELEGLAAQFVRRPRNTLGAFQQELQA